MKRSNEDNNLKNDNFNKKKQNVKRSKSGHIISSNSNANPNPTSNAQNKTSNTNPNSPANAKPGVTQTQYAHIIKQNKQNTQKPKLNQNQKFKQKLNQNQSQNQNQNQNKNQQQNEEKNKNQKQNEKSNPNEKGNVVSDSILVEKKAPQILRMQRSQRTMLKNIFDTPFDIPWYPLTPSDQNLVIQKLESTFSFIKLEEIERKKELYRKRQDLLNSKHHIPDSTLVQEPTPIDLNADITAPDPLSSEHTAGSTSQKNEEHSKNGIVFGINAVTKALEQSKLALVVVCKKGLPLVTIQHIPVLCSLRSVILCCLDTPSHTVGTIFGLNSVAAIGILKDPPTHKDLVDEIGAISKPVVLPWLINRNSKNVTLKPVNCTKQFKGNNSNRGSFHHKPKKQKR
eukprot:TRINITY_DN2208_c0_g1_i1.p1 TRINITY_DN2208_c0_g1~~TRINITY_DN2208_c0_g1_i1.p1  ORF type:complete len:398 (-),score=92.51 TRINITY_DN2208_c0_g1_i1:84-1277(-)